MNSAFISTYLEKYSEDRQTIFNHCASGVEANAKDINVFDRWLKQEKHELINDHVLIEFMRYLRDERGNAPGSINRKISSIKEYIRYLRFLEIDGAETVRVDEWRRACMPYSGPVSVLTMEEVQLILSLIDRESRLGFRDFTLFTLMYRLGLRIGEVRRIKLEDLDLVKETVLVHGKGRKKRLLPLTPDLTQLISQWLQVRKLMKNSSILEELFVSKKGNAISERSIQENFAKLIARAGELSLEKVTPHSLRHAFASHAMDSDCELITLKYFLGHARLCSTEIYLHPSMKKMRTCVNDHVAHDILEELIGDELLILRVHQQIKETG